MPAAPKVPREGTNASGGHVLLTRPQAMRADLSAYGQLPPNSLRPPVTITFAHRTIGHDNAGEHVSAAIAPPSVPPPPIPPPPVDPPSIPRSQSLELADRSLHHADLDHGDYDADTQTIAVNESPRKRKAEAFVLEEPTSKRVATEHGDDDTTLDTAILVNVAHTLRTLDRLFKKAVTSFMDLWTVAPLVAERLSHDSHFKAMTDQLAVADGCVGAIIAELPQPVVSEPSVHDENDQQTWDYDAVFAILTAIIRIPHAPKVFRELRTLFAAHADFARSSPALHQIALQYKPYVAFNSAVLHTLPLPLHKIDQALDPNISQDVDMSTSNTSSGNNEDIAAQAELEALLRWTATLDLDMPKSTVPTRRFVDTGCQSELLFEQGECDQADFAKLAEHAISAIRGFRDFRGFLADKKELAELLRVEPICRTFSSKMTKLERVMKEFR
ncbi:hypothetical protein CALVIDRAFT_560267 [Calocera viscosa TUFC12733]|uniref:Uncharacterized protein n=1 Tax=Calocera viscosa (strain TUFC12733) TaxID=1330018 RepID=A0A167RJF8_CALVF|nr:hypothetical protein CALVIDRAFT_560267 [Calocera viscosa TUFC12733]